MFSYKRRKFRFLLIIFVFLIVLLNYRNQQETCRAKPSFFNRENYKEKQNEWKEFINQINLIEFNNPTKGILITSHHKVVTQTIYSINVIRSLGCKLPIQVWFYEKDLNNEDIQRLKIQGVTTHDLSLALLDHPEFNIKDTKGSDGRMYQVKGASILLSSLSQILYLDSDNVPIRDPTYLFDTTLYTTKKAIFWPDFWKTSESNPIWEILDIDCTQEYEQESGQILIDKRSPKVVKALSLAVYMQSQSDFYFKFLFGDKDTFRFGFRALGVDYFMVKEHVGIIGSFVYGFYCGHTIIQYEPQEVQKLCLIDNDCIDCNISNDCESCECNREKPQMLFLHMNGLKGTNRNNQDSFGFIKRYQKSVESKSKAIVYPYPTLSGIYKNEFCTNMFSVDGNPVEMVSFESENNQFKQLYQNAQDLESNKE